MDDLHKPDLERTQGRNLDPFAVGSVLSGKYKIVKLIGQGGMGAVYQATQLLLGIDVALKTLDTQRLNDSTSIRRFQTEARAAFSLKHPNLVNVYDFGVLETQQPFLVMEFIRGCTLQDYIKKHSPLSLSDIKDIFVQLCFGLSYAHQNNVVHRDVKPGNIMILSDLPLTSEGSVKILDFGIAKVLNTFNSEVEALTKTGDVFGSPLYMSPEQCSGASVDQASDIYSLGCVLFEALTGTPPLVGANPLRTMMLHQTADSPTLKEAALGREFPDGLERIVAKMLAKNPSERYRDLGTVAIDLAEVVRPYDHSDAPFITASPSLPLKVPAPVRPYGPNLSWTNFCLLLFIVIGLSTGLGYFLGTFSKHNIDGASTSNSLTSVSKKDSVDPVTGLHDDSLDDDSSVATRLRNHQKQKAHDDFARASKILSFPPKPGDKLRVISFPDTSIGKIEYQGEDGQQVTEEACGLLKVPVAARLTYILDDQDSAAVLSNASILDKIDKNLFAGLNFSGSAKISSLAILDESDAEHSSEVEPGILHLFNTASTWPFLDDISISHVFFTPQIAKGLSQVTGLKALAIRKCSIDPKQFGTKFWNKLERITLTYLHCDDILRELHNSPKLQVVKIDKCVFTSAALERLVNSPELRSLTVIADGKRKSDDRLFDTIFHQMKSLKLVALSKEYISEAQLNQLKDEGWKQVIPSRNENDLIVLSR